MKNYAVILASGSGSRMGSDIPKQFLKIKDKTILEYSIEAFELSKSIDYIVLVITSEYKAMAEKIISENNYKKVSKVLCGGKERKDSSFIGINSIEETEANVLIHDCARPLVSQNIIENCIKALEANNAVCTAIPSSDTILEVQNGTIKNIPDRKTLMRAQTPQGFKLSLIKKAHELSKNDVEFTDDCGLVIKHNLSDIAIVEGSQENIKITYPNDISFANCIIG